MAEQFIVCPHCRKKIPLTEAISHQIKEELEKESDKKLQEKIKKLEKAAKKKARNAVDTELKDLKEQVEEKDRKLDEVQKAELEIRKARRKLEDEKKTFELEMARKLDGARKQIEEKASKRLMEEQRFKDAEKEKLIKDMRKQIGELKRRSEQGSQQLQGEVMELGLEELLKSSFPNDDIQPVPTGIKGADITQKVHDETGRYCGSIVWETKRTKAWSNGWIQKLKNDQRELRAEVAALVSEVLPKDVKGFGCVNSVWVLGYNSVIGLATALRHGLLDVSRTILARRGQEEKSERLYGYLSGPHFRQRVEAIVEAFSAMKEDLDKEKRAINKIWAKREKQIERVIGNTVGMYGDLEGIIGRAMPQIENLELKALGAGVEEGGEGSEEVKL